MIINEMVSRITKQILKMTREEECYGSVRYVCLQIMQTLLTVRTHEFTYLIHDGIEVLGIR